VTTLALMQYVQNVVSVEEQPLRFGLTLERRLEIAAKFPTTKAELAAVRHSRSSAVTTFDLGASDGEEKEFQVRFQSSASPGTPLHRPPTLFYKTVIYGIPLEEFNDKVEQELADLPVQPESTAPCTFDFQERAGASAGWKAQGVCLLFSKDKSTTELESSLQLLTLKHGQPILFKWWPHVWGGEERTHHTFMQSTIPVLASLTDLKTHHPVYLV
jgi:hypothetical protein